LRARALRRDVLPRRGIERAWPTMAAGRGPLARRPIGLARWAAAQAEGLAALALVTVRVLDEVEHARHVHPALARGEAAAEAGVGRQRVLLVEVPHLLGVRQATRAGHEPREEAVQVLDVAEEE